MLLACYEKMHRPNRDVRSSLKHFFVVYTLLEICQKASGTNGTAHLHPCSNPLLVICHVYDQLHHERCEVGPPPQPQWSGRWRISKDGQELKLSMMWALNNFKTQITDTCLVYHGSCPTIMPHPPIFRMCTTLPLSITVEGIHFALYSVKHEEHNAPARHLRAGWSRWPPYQHCPLSPLPHLHLLGYISLK
jgi:hypothetical protein